MAGGAVVKRMGPFGVYFALGAVSVGTVGTLNGTKIFQTCRIEKN